MLPFVLTVIFVAGIAPTHAAPVCALIDSTKDPAIALLETQLLADDKTAWVERTEIDRLLAEQELQTAFAAEGKGRRALGKLLKADVLVLLRRTKNSNPNGKELLDCVVCETKRGLRLRMLTVTVEKEMKTAVEELHAAIQQGLKKYEEQIETVVTVPPFLSEDVGIELNYLQSVYARVIQERLLECKGVLVVELAEAQAVAKELSLSDPGSALTGIKPPSYIIGRYRHDGAGNDRTMRMSLRLMQGDEQITLKGVKDLSPAEIPNWIAAKTDELLPLIQATAPRGEFSAAAEAKRLAERGMQFQRIGSWLEALELFEASLLFDPQQKEIHRQAVVAINQHFDSKINTKKDLAFYREVCPLVERGLGHLESFMRVMESAPIVDRLDNLGLEIKNSVLFVNRFETNPESIQLRDQAIIARKNTYLRIAKLRLAKGQADDYWWLAGAVSSAQGRERYSQILELINEIENIPDVPLCMERMFFGVYANNLSMPRDELEEILKELEQSPDKRLNNAVKKFKPRIDSFFDFRSPPGSKPAPEPIVEIDRSLQQVPLPNPPRRKFDHPASWQESIANPALDFFISQNSLLSMAQPNTLDQLFSYDKVNVLIRSAVYDGQLLWSNGVTPSPDSKVVLTAIDPMAERTPFSQKVYSFGAEQGLPASKSLKIAAIGKGKVVVAAMNVRSWVGVCSVSPEGERSFELVFEAKDVPPANAPIELEKTTNAFDPGFMFVGHDLNGNEPCLLLQRQNHTKRECPLLVNLNQKTAKVSAVVMHGSIPSRRIAFSGNSLYWIEDLGLKRLRLNELKYPFEKQTVILNDCPDGYLVPTADGIHIIGKEWWLVNPSNGSILSLASKVPWHTYYQGTSNDITWHEAQQVFTLERVLPSTFHGPIAVTSKPKTSFVNGRPNTIVERQYWQITPEVLRQSP